MGGPAAAVVPGYEVLEELGRGGQARVYRARQLAVNRVVALKVLDRCRLDETALRRFRHECESAGTLSWHPHIVAVHDAGTTPDGLPYLSMEYLQGGSLGDRLEREGRLLPDEAASIGVQLAGALETAHREGMLHRDVKPDNVLVGRFGEAKLTDFGIAAITGATVTATGTITATLAHAAPEVLSGERASAASDVYSLGSTLFALLTGRPAFVKETDESIMAVVARVAADAVPDLRTQGVPDPVAVVVEAAMAKAPDERPASAVALGEALQEAQRSLGMPVTELRVLDVAPAPARGQATVTVGGPPRPDETPAPEAAAGSVSLIRDRYEPLETVGRGGQGEVVRAMDHMHGRPVALKIRPVHSTAEREEILEEARILRTLRPHPGITLVREDFFDADSYVMVMDWVEGRSLSRLVEDEGALALEHAAPVLTQAAAALDHLHAHNPPVVHGDVKPANVVVTPDGHVVVVDFGIAVRGPASPRLSTSGYAAPEIARGEPVTPASDVYSLAATAVTLLTGEPFALGVRPELGLPRPEARRLERALQEALHLDPRSRPASAGAFVEALVPRPPPHNLPAALTSFVGRRRERREAHGQLRRARLLTLTGPGGVGKTRLGLAVAQAALADFPGGVWFVQLAPLAAPDLVADEVARTLAVPLEPGQTAEARLAAFFGEERALIVLDNAEHLLPGVERSARGLLEACPALTILATSREPLGLPGEEVLRVPPLSVPAEPAAARRSEAVRLFGDRARSACRTFRLSADAAPAVVEICRRLDGIPLALELAAARVSSFAPAELAQRLDERFGLLVAPGEPLPHHRTLRATIEWSFDLLSPPERALLTRLAVFAGPFGLDAACEVCAGEEIGADDLPSLLASLVDKSLVLREGLNGASRYRMLETVRELAAEALGDSVRRRHLAWCAALAEQGGDDAAWLERVAAALDDLRAALGWSVDVSPRDGLTLACSLAHFWMVRGPYAEGRAWTERALAAAGDALDAELRARALHEAGNLAFRAGEYPVAEDLLERGLAIRRETGDRAGEAKALNSLGAVAMERGDNAPARELFEESAAIGRALGDVALVDAPVGNLGLIAVAEGDFARARELHSESLAIARERGDAVGVAYSTENLGVAEQRLGNTDEALRLYRESLGMLRDLGDARAMGDVVLLIGLLALEQGRFAYATRLIAAAEATRSAAGAQLPEYGRSEFERAMADMRAGAGEEAFREAWEEGSRAVFGDVVASLLEE